MKGLYKGQKRPEEQQDESLIASSASSSPLHPAPCIQPPHISVITPAFNESANLTDLYERVTQALDSLRSQEQFHHITWEWLIIDDHSTDTTPQILSRLAAHDQRLKIIRFSRNFGSHRAISCGLHQAQGQAAIVLAADLQDPPELFARLLENWHKGNDIVWAVREAERREIGTLDRLFSRLYYAMMRRFAEMPQLPPSGADFFLVSRNVIEAFRQFRETNVSILVLLCWLGFKQASIVYTKQSRKKGHSGWTWEKKVKLLVDSVTAFTYAPIRMITYTGITVSLLGFIFAAMIIIEYFIKSPPTGYASLMVIMLCLGGMTLIMLGVLGEYLWRALDESKNRPQYVIEYQSSKFEYTPRQPHPQQQQVQQQVQQQFLTHPNSYPNRSRIERITSAGDIGSE